MSEDAFDRRLPLFAYLHSLLSGRRVLEVGRGSPEGAEALRAMGARVVSIEGDGAGIDDRFDVVLVSHGEALVRKPGAVAAWRRLLAEKGRLIVAAASADRGGGGGGLGYYDLHDAIAAHFPKVQMLGLTPFLGMGVVEFEGAVDGLRIDSRLLKDGVEPPAAYVALAGSEPVAGLGYALVQVPFGPFEARLGGGRASSRPSALLLEEIEELRGRLRRAGEDRAAQDAEVAKLRRALTEADETVLKLTRRTAEEMTAVAERFAGYRSPKEKALEIELGAAQEEAERLRVKLAEAEARAAAAEQRLEEIGGATREREQALEDALERLRLADSELARARRTAAKYEEEARAAAAAAESAEESGRALAARDDRIAALEIEKQDLVWRLAELEDKLRDAIARAVKAGVVAPPPVKAGVVAPPPLPNTAAPSGGRVAEAGRSRGDDGGGRGLEEFHRAAAAHVQEITELKAAVAEQAALVAEMEDALAAAEARVAAAENEATAARKTAKDMEEADRSRRSRLAELEGKLLRLEHERKAASEAEAGGAGESGRAVEELRREADGLRAARDEIARRLADERAAWSEERDALRREVEARPIEKPASNGHGPDRSVLDRSVPDRSLDDRLENAIGNYRQRAGRLRDDVEGVRRRIESLSPHEIAGFLEELGEDLAELEK